MAMRLLAATAFGSEISFIAYRSQKGMLMKIKVRLFATLRKDRGREVEVEVGDEPTCQAVIDALSIDEADVAILLVNGLDGTLNQSLSSGDVVSIFPPVGGG